jgi:membrane protease YdiL (CAAX protease family)
MFSPNKNPSSLSSSNYKLFLSVLIIGPILEEVLFRSWLRISPRIVAILLSILYIVKIAPMIFNQKLFESVQTFFMVAIPGLLIFYFAYKASEKIISVKTKEMWNNNRLYLFYGSSILFGYAHVFNYETTTNLLLFSPLILLPNIVSGMFAGYIRINMGFKYGVLYHAINNAIPLIIFKSIM